MSRAPVFSVEDKVRIVLSILAGEPKHPTPRTRTTPNWTICRRLLAAANRSSCAQNRSAPPGPGEFITLRGRSTLTPGRGNRRYGRKPHRESGSWGAAPN
jgi:hypothetical protein